MATERGRSVDQRELLFTRAVEKMDTRQAYYAHTIGEQIGELARALDIDAFDTITGILSGHRRQRILGIRVEGAGRHLNEEYVIQPDGSILRMRLNDQNLMLVEFDTERAPTDEDLIHDRTKLTEALKAKLDEAPRRITNRRRREKRRQDKLDKAAELEAITLFDKIDPDWRTNGDERGPLVDSVPPSLGMERSRSATK